MEFSLPARVHRNYLPADRLALISATVQPE
jgi:hypothetical protein